MSQDLAQWLLEQIAEDERAAAAMRPGLQLYVCDGNGCLEEPDGEWADGEPHLPNHHANWLGPVLSPARVLAECEAKRKIVMRCALLLEAFDDPDRGAWPDVNRRERYHARATLEALALPFADRPGYRDEWRP